MLMYMSAVYIDLVVLFICLCLFEEINPSHLTLSLLLLVRLFFFDAFFSFLRTDVFPSLSFLPSRLWIDAEAGVKPLFEKKSRLWIHSRPPVPILLFRFGRLGWFACTAFNLFLAS
ncbi:hypothetical protein VPH35_089012 [Triticum aestivum]